MYLGLVAEKTSCLVHIGIGRHDVPGLPWLLVDNSLPVEVLLQKADQFTQPGSLRSSQIDDLIPLHALDRAQEPVDDIADVGVVSAGRAVAESDRKSTR